MPDDRDEGRERGRAGRPDYTLYHSKPRGLRERLRGEDAGLDELRDGAQAPPRERRARWRRRARSAPAAPGIRRRRPITPRRALKWIALAIGGWLLFSLVLFLLSAQIEQSKVSDAAKSALKPAGFPLTSANTILLLGSDARPKASKEPGANPGGPSRSDTIMLWRVGAGHAARLSIPRDTIVSIPGHGQDKINAAYAYGGAALSIRTIESYLGIPVNHLVEVSFENFPKLIDALGGVDVSTGRVCSQISGGVRNGGQTLKLSAGTHHLSGQQALVLARTRHNDCNPAEDDLTRAKRQQQILSGMKDSLLSPLSFFRLPWISWYTPKAMQTDMGGPTLLGFFASVAASGSPPVQVLKPSSFVTLPNGGSGLAVSDAERRAAVQRFLSG
jgi:LCP family protein required for cell wall assembly